MERHLREQSGVVVRGKTTFHSTVREQANGVAANCGGGSFPTGARQPLLIPL
jgi:hypothetical protein